MLSFLSVRNDPKGTTCVRVGDLALLAFGVSLAYWGLDDIDRHQLLSYHRVSGFYMAPIGLGWMLVAVWNCTGRHRVDSSQHWCFGCQPIHALCVISLVGGLTLLLTWIFIVPLEDWGVYLLARPLLLCLPFGLHGLHECIDRWTSQGSLRRAFCSRCDRKQAVAAAQYFRHSPHQILTGDGTDGVNVSIKLSAIKIMS